jgi:hypothetical protein
LDVAREAYPKLPADEIWFADHLKSKIKLAYEADEVLFENSALIGCIGMSRSLIRLYLKLSSRLSRIRSQIWLPRLSARSKT